MEQITQCCIFALFGKKEALKMLLTANANANVITGNGQSALMLAVAGSKHVCVKLLLQYGADKECKDREGKTALDVAMELQDNELIHLLQ